MKIFLFFFFFFPLSRPTRIYFYMYTYIKLAFARMFRSCAHSVTKTMLQFKHTRVLVSPFPRLKKKKKKNIHLFGPGVTEHRLIALEEMYTHKQMQSHHIIYIYKVRSIKTKNSVGCYMPRQRDSKL